MQYGPLTSHLTLAKQTLKTHISLMKLRIQVVIHTIVNCRHTMFFSILCYLLSLPLAGVSRKYWGLYQYEYIIQFSCILMFCTYKSIFKFKYTIRTKPSQCIRWWVRIYPIIFRDHQDITPPAETILKPWADQKRLDAILSCTWCSRQKFGLTYTYTIEICWNKPEYIRLRLVKGNQPIIFGFISTWILCYSIL